MALEIHRSCTSWQCAMTPLVPGVIKRTSRSRQTPCVALDGYVDFDGAQGLFGEFLRNAGVKCLAADDDHVVHSVDLAIEDGRLVITPPARPSYSLDELLGGVTEKNQHAEVDAGAPRGGEVW